MADPEQYRTKEQVQEWRERDPIPAYAAKLEGEVDLDELDEAAKARIDEAVEFAENAEFPEPESMYDHVYVG
jgi:pyruvate dehydrogenase E1 component alpha subunit